jgi:thioredoxin-like negative regulator of GroEL
MIKKIILLCFLPFSMAGNTVKIATAEEIEKAITSKKPIVVIISSKACGPCEALKRAISNTSYPGITIYTIDASKSSSLAIGEKIKSVPVTIGYVDGKKKFIIRGYSSSIKETLNNTINSLKSKT